MDLNDLSNEFAYRAYILDRDQIRRHLAELNIREYIALLRIARVSTGEGRIYLKDLADNMRLTTRQIAKMAGDLKNRGLVIWSHDGDGSEGTYLTVTEAGENLLQKNEEILRKHYGRVIEKYGEEQMIQLLQMMQRLEQVMRSEFSDSMEGEVDDGIFE